MKNPDVVRDRMVGESLGIKQVFDRVRKVSASDSSVLITGESGTGKELVARAICRSGPRSSGPMVVINCGAIPHELLESELFGHERGAFTGAHRARTGRFELADRGTVFLDEIGDMSPDLQVKLLRALQERRIERVGGSESIEVDIRIISATNKDLVASIEKKVFREDLFYRLNVVPIHIPPLRDRISDIPLLLDHFQQQLKARVDGYAIKEFSSEVLDLLAGYPWPGNVRELENLMERLAVLVENRIVQPGDLPDHIRQKPAAGTLPGVSTLLEEGVGFHDAVEQFQTAMISSALDQTGWVKARAAELLKMNRTTLVEKIKKMGIEPEYQGPVF
ncbi:MAG: sigma-54 dependent transcriptional regulator [Desulfobacteraceae bacterium]